MLMVHCDIVDAHQLSSGTRFYKVVSGDSCAGIVDKYRTFTLDDFYSWNLAVGNDCHNLQAGYYVCVGVPGTPTTPPSTTATPTPTGPSPTQTGIISTCTRFYKAVAGDSCSSIASSFGLYKPLGGILLLRGRPRNPYNKADDDDRDADWDRAPASAAGIVSNCNKYYKVQSGQGCWDIEHANGITTDQFFAWNTGIKTDCSNLFSGYYVCIGVSS
ncbi:hypothetical protein VTN00DRAFT_2010 [Thermoascus crustaceus]|uniref:uncharacterized protein n=1 Tax=Thermoascus crustaceus TaxID=5088 RepID=UPI00374443A1